MPVAHATAPAVPSNVPAEQRPEIVELERIIVEAGGGPTIDPTRTPNGTIDPGWDPADVWMLEYHQRGAEVSLIGQGDSPADVVQLALRLQVSKAFDRIVVRKVERRFDAQRGEHGQDVFQFEITLVSLDPHPPAEPISITEW